MSDFHPATRLVPRELRVQLDPTNEKDMLGVTLVADVHYPSGRTEPSRHFFWSLPDAHTGLCPGVECQAHYDHLLAAVEDCIKDLRQREGLSG